MATDAIIAATKIVKDPALSEVACNVLRLNRVVEGEPAGAPCQRLHYTEAQKSTGVGLYSVVGPIRAYTWARQNPLLALALGGSAVFLLVAFGYSLGRGRR